MITKVLTPDYRLRLGWSHRISLPSVVLLVMAAALLLAGNRPVNSAASKDPKIGIQEVRSTNAGGLPVTTTNFGAQKVEVPTKPTVGGCLTPPDGLVDWWPFDETSGTTAQDIAGSVNNAGTYVNGPTPMPGEVSGALCFDGVNDYVGVADQPEINFLGDCSNDAAEAFTIDAWVRTTQSSGLAVILDKRSTVPALAGYHLFLFNGRLGFQMAVGGTFMNFVAPPSSPNVAIGQWTLVTVTVSRCRGGQGRLYVCGDLVLSFDPLVGDLNNTANLNIGRRDPALGDIYFNGCIDELEIFKRVLAQDEVQAICNAGSLGKCKCVTPPDNMVDWWPFDETGGPTAQDISGFNNVGTYHNSPTPTPGIVGGALCFDGVNQFVDVANQDQINFFGDCFADAAEDFTIDAWVRTTQINGVAVILDKRSIVSNVPVGYHLFLSDGRLGFQMAVASGFTNFIAPPCPGPGCNVANGSWNLVTVTVHRCRFGEGRLYVNGVLVLTFDPLFGDLNNTSKLNIGRREPALSDPALTDNFFNGCIDELEIFKRALAQDEVQAIFNAGSHGKCKADCSVPVFANGCPAPVTVTAQASCPVATSALVNYSIPTVTDNCSTATVSCNPAPGSMFPVGTTTVTCTATDPSGNIAVCTFTVSVFSFCLQDETISGNVVLVNALTGDYSFCCGGVLIASGRGTLTTKGCIGSIDHFKGDRKVHIQWDTSANSGAGAGTAYVQKPLGGSTICQITDKKLTNNTCQCF